MIHPREHRVRRAMGRTRPEDETFQRLVVAGVHLAGAFWTFFRGHPILATEGHLGYFSQLCSLLIVDLGNRFPLFYEPIGKYHQVHISIVWQVFWVLEFVDELCDSLAHIVVALSVIAGQVEHD